MINIKLLLQAAELGIKPQKTDPNRTLAEAAESRDLRLWATFPAMLANAAEGGSFNLRAAKAFLGEDGNRMLELLIFVSLGLYESLGVRFPWRKKLLAAFPERMVSDFAEKFALGRTLELDGLEIGAEDFKKSFRRYFSAGAGDRPLQRSLSRIFTPRQAELFFKRLRGERMTKTEREYFSRVVKKKTLALADEELHSLARRVLGSVRREEGQDED